MDFSRQIGSPRSSRLLSCIGWRSISTRSLSRVKKLGKGSYGSVYATTLSTCDNLTPSTLAEKVYRCHSDDVGEGIYYLTLREVAVLASASHESFPNPIYLKMAHPFTLFMELGPPCLNRTRMAHLRLHTLQASAFIVKLIDAVYYAHHTLNCMNRDMKPENILWDNATQKLFFIDWGLCRTFNASHDNLTPEVQTLWYRAPELLLGTKSYSCKVDVWSLGLIIFRLWTGRGFEGRCELEQLHLYIKAFGSPPKDVFKDFPIFSDALPVLKEDPKIWAGLSTLQVDFLKKLLTYNPQDRPTMTEVRNLALRCLPHLTHIEVERLQRTYPSYYDRTLYKGISIESLSGWPKAMRAVIFHGHDLTERLGSHGYAASLLHRFLSVSRQSFTDSRLVFYAKACLWIVTKLFGYSSFPSDFGIRASASRKAFSKAEEEICVALKFDLWDGSPHLYYRREMEGQDNELGSHLLDLVLFQDVAFTEPKAIGPLVARLVTSDPSTYSESEKRFISSCLESLDVLERQKHEGWISSLRESICKTLI